MITNLIYAFSCVDVSVEALQNTKSCYSWSLPVLGCTESRRLLVFIDMYCISLHYRLPNNHIATLGGPISKYYFTQLLF